MASRKGSSEAAAAASAPSLPLELAGPFYDTSTLVAVSKTTKACAASKMLAAQWAGVFSRRFPCLTALPAFQAPLADAKALVKGLLTATPPPPEPPRRGRSRGSPLPAVPLDGAGRALPLRELTIVAVQLSKRGDAALLDRPLLFGHRRVGVGCMEVANEDNEDGRYGYNGPNWEEEIPLQATAQTETLDELRSIKKALSLPDCVFLEQGTGEATPNVRSLCQDMCPAAEATLRQDVFVVAGSEVWRMGDASHTCAGSLARCESMLQSNFDWYIDRITEFGGNGEPTDRGPIVFLGILFNRMNLAMSMRWNLAAYGHHDRFAPVVEPLDYYTDCYSLGCYLIAPWRQLVIDNIVDRHPGTNIDYDEDLDEDDGHPYLCQLLAATRPVRVQTK